MIFAVQILYYDIDGFMNKLHALQGSRLRAATYGYCCIAPSMVASSFRLSLPTSSWNQRSAFTPSVEVEVFNASTINATYLALEPTSNALAVPRPSKRSFFAATKHRPLEVKLTDATHRQLFCVAHSGLLLALLCIACLHIGRDGHLIRRKRRFIARGVGTLLKFVLHLLRDRISPLGVATSRAPRHFGFIWKSCSEEQNSSRNTANSSTGQKHSEPHLADEHTAEHSTSMHMHTHAHTHTLSILSRNY